MGPFSSDRFSNAPFSQGPLSAAPLSVASLSAGRNGNARKFRVSAFVVAGAACGADMVTLTAAGLIACAMSRWPQPGTASGGDLLLALAGALGGMTALQGLKTYRMSALCAPLAQWHRAGAAVLLGGACFAAAAALGRVPDADLLRRTAIWGVAAAGLLGCERVAASAMIGRWCASGRVVRRLAVVGSLPDCDSRLARVGTVTSPAADNVGDPDHVGLGGAAGLPPLSAWQMLQKTLFDRCAALLLLVLVSPVLLAIAIAVRLDSRGPALFRQTRIGLNNVPFVCFKFRSMYHDTADAGLLLQATRGDRRVTRIGAWLRRTSIDELPQLLNVLRGEMSLVGPRPHAPDTRAAGRLFDDAVTNYHSRHSVRPGITGWAQIHGWRGETPTVESLEERVRHDLFYVQNWSMRLDLQILLRTVRVMLHDSRAY